MTLVQWIGLGLALAIMLLGMIGCVMPGLPGTPLVLAAAVAHRFYFGASSVSNVMLVVLVLLTVLSLLLDYFASVLGARKMGATWRGIAGAIFGAMVGLFFGLPGILLGPFLGALAFELLSGRDFAEATRAGAGALFGLVIGAAGKLACCAAMMGLFAVNVISRSSATVEAATSFSGWN